MPKTNLIYCDSCVFLSYFNQNAERIATLDELFQEVSEGGEKLIITSVLTVTEVAHLAIEKERWRTRPDVEQTLDAFWTNTSLLELIDFHSFIAVQARSFMRRAIDLKFVLKPMDAIHLATCEWAGAGEFFTYDDLKRFEPLFSFHVREPYVSQPRLRGDDGTAL